MSYRQTEVGTNASQILNQCQVGASAVRNNPGKTLSRLLKTSPGVGTGPTKSVVFQE